MSIKIMICGRRRPGQTLSGHRRHMKDVHGQLVLGYIAAEPDNAPRRYVQNHGFDSTFSAGDPGSDPVALGFDFVTEVWAPDGAAAKRSVETPYYKEKLLPDEPLMVDTARVAAAPFREVAVSGGPHAGAAFKVFGIIGKAAAMPGDGLQAALGDLFAKADLPASLQHSRNIALGPGTIGVIEAFRFAGEAEAQDFAAAYQTAVLKPLAAQQGAEPGSSCIVIAKEYVLFAGH